MALLINNEFEPAPDGFGCVVRGDRLVCSYLNGYDTDKGDAYTPAGEMPLLADVSLRFSDTTTATEVYRHIQYSVDKALATGL